MKTTFRIVLLLFVLSPVVHAQDFIEIGVGRHFVNGIKVNQKVIKEMIFLHGGVESRRLYTRFKSKQSVAIVLVSAGMIMYYAGLVKNAETYYQEGSGLQLVGLTAMIVASGISISAKSDQFKSIHKYNAGLGFGPTSSGIGFFYNF